MTAFFLTFMTLAAASGLEPGVFGPSSLALLVDQNGVLQAVHTETSEVLWSRDTGGPMVWAERLEHCHQALFYPRASGELFLMKTEKSPLQRFETSVQDIARAGTAEFDWEYYFQGSIHISALTLNLKSGTDVLSSSPTDCTIVTLERVDYRLDLVEKERLVTVSQINVSEMSIKGCVQTDLSELQGYERIRRRFGEVRFLGFYGEEPQREDWTWVLEYPKTLLAFVALGLLVGFRLAVKGEDETVKVSVSPCKSPRSDTATASTSAFTSPIISEKTSPKSGFPRRVCLSIETRPQLAPAPLDLETPLHASSDARIKDLISDGRFTDTFESAKLLHARGGQKVFEARHKLEGKSYVVKVAKFSYEEAETIAEVTMFREVAAMMKFRHKHIVNYVTCWVENEDVVPTEKGEHSEDSEEEDGVTYRPVSPSSDQKTGFLYIQRELVKGESLKERLKHRETVDRRENCLIFRQILKAVAHIHAKNIVHRGLQPSCIYVTRDDVVKVGDFRLAAKARSARSRHSLILPSSPYTAPECLFQLEVTKTIDIYPLGLVLLELCLPSNFPGRREALLDVRGGRGLPEELDSMRAEREIVLWLSASEPSRRPSAQELLESEELREWEKEVGLSPCLVGLSPMQCPL